MLTNTQREHRKHGIGGSDAAAVAGLSRWRTPYDLYLEKTGNGHPESTDLREPLYFGQLLEPIIAEEYAKRTGKTVYEDTQTYTHPQYPWMMAHIDRRIAGENRILECKTASSYTQHAWGDLGTDDIPTEYLLQCAHYACVLEVAEVDIAVLLGGQSFRIYTYQRNAPLERHLIELEQNFWLNHVQKRCPPLPSHNQEAALIWNSPSEDRLLADEETEHQLTTLVTLKNKLKTLEQEKEALELALKCKLKEASSFTNTAGQCLASWKAQTTQRFDVQSFKTAYPDLYSQFLKSTTHRVFRVKELNDGHE